jgi:hypothetical protein
MKLVPSKLVPTKVGADRKKVAILAGLCVVLVVVYFVERTPSVPDTAPARPIVSNVTQVRPNPAGPRTLPPELSPGPRVATRGAQTERSSIADFRPTLKLKEGTDVSKIDPSLHTELLAKVKTVALTGGTRSLFEFAPPPAPPPPEVAKIYPKVGPTLPPPPPTPTTTAPPAAPPPPPIPLKFYGFSGTARSSGIRSAFFLDGDEIVIARESETIRNRYKIVRIGVNSAVVEDTTNKNQQTLPLVEELGS